jgi:hypothetical protein
MNNAQPLWLRGETDSPCSVRRWTEEKARQFVVLPFYEDKTVQPGRESYMLWGRALSDDGFYPISHDWYSMNLVPAGYSIGCYQWVCRCDLAEEPVWSLTNRRLALTLTTEWCRSQWTLTETWSHQNRCKLHSLRSTDLQRNSTPMRDCGSAAAAQTHPVTACTWNRLGYCAKGGRADVLALLKSSLEVSRGSEFKEPQHVSGTAAARRATRIQTQMPKRQAEEGGGHGGRHLHARRRSSGSAAAEVAADLRDGIHKMVKVNLLPSTVWSPGHSFPTTDNVQLLRAEAQFWSLGADKLRHLFTDTSPLTAVEAATVTSRQYKQSGRCPG